MYRRIRAVVEGGVIRPLEPLELPEGREVELVVTPVPTPEEVAASAGRLEENLRRLQEVAAQYPEEWWEQFELDLQEGRTGALKPK